MNFKNLAMAEQWCIRIASNPKWWDEYVPEFLYRYWVRKIAWVDTYSILSDTIHKDNITNTLYILDKWSAFINAWCDNNMVDDAPYCVRMTAKQFLDRGIAKYSKLV